jgi:hypothetical protein
MGPVSPPEPPPVGITLEDAKRFGVLPETVGALAKIAANHSDLMRGTVTTANNPDVVWMWERECTWRFECWNLLRIALDDAAARTQAWLCLSPEDDREPTEAEIRLAKLNCLDQLRDKIGDVAYYAGRMPAPVCRYRPWSD